MVNVLHINLRPLVNNVAIILLLLCSNKLLFIRQVASLYSHFTRTQSIRQQNGDNWRASRRSVEINVHTRCHILLSPRTRIAIF